MKTRRQTLKTLLLLSGAVALPAESKLQPLFNGKNFNGWTTAGGGVWSVEDGVIVGRFDRANPGAGYLMSEREYEDFTLMLEFWISKGGNSGVFIREPKQAWSSKGNARPAIGDLAGYEIQISYAGVEKGTGMIYGIKSPEKLAGREEHWNTMKIECRGILTEVWVDGEMVNTYRETKRQRGVVGLQVHGGTPHDHIVKFRNIKILS